MLTPGTYHTIITVQAANESPPTKVIFRTHTGVREISAQRYEHEMFDLLLDEMKTRIENDEGWRAGSCQAVVLFYSVTPN